jgi:hypothetical protein
MNPSEKVVTLLQTLLSRRERDRAPIRPTTVIGRHTDGTERLQRQDATCATRGGRDNHYTGTTVLSRASSTNRQGTTGIGTTQFLSSPTLWIESLEPNTFEPGQIYQVTVTGRGFDQSTTLHFLDPDPTVQEGTLNPDLEILTLTVLDPEHLHLELSISPTARPLTNAPIAYGRT